MSALGEPSRAPSPPLASPVALRHRRSAPSPTASYGPARSSRARGVRFTEGPESSRRPLAKRSHLLSSEKMEERLEAPSVVSNSLPASAGPRGVSSARSRRLSAPDRVMCRAFPVTFVPDTCAPFRSGAGLWFQRLCAIGFAPRGTSPRALLAAPLRMKRGCRPPRQRIGAVRERLARPPAACLATGHGA